MAFPYVWWQAETLSVGQGEQLVVVQDGVEILNPLGVDVAVEDDPLALLQLASDIVDDSEMVKDEKRLKLQLFNR